MNVRKGIAYGTMYIGFLFTLFGVMVWLPTTGVEFYQAMIGLGVVFGIIGFGFLLWRTDK